MSSPRDPTQFTRESAERIGRVVRAAELSTPGPRPLNFDREDFFRSAKVFRIATYTGAWLTGSSKTVTFKYKTDTPNTATVLNLFFPVTSTAAGSRDCAIAKEGTAWFLVDVRLGTATAVFVRTVATAAYVQSVTTQSINVVSAVSTASTAVMMDVTLSASLNTSNCTISIGKTLATASITFVRSVTTANQIAVTSRVTATATFVETTGTGTYLTLEV